MNSRERVEACLNYKPYDRLPVLHFGFWGDTLKKWVEEGFIDKQLKTKDVVRKLGFDFGWADSLCFTPKVDLDPAFERKVIEELPDGTRKVINPVGMVVLEKDGATGIPPEIDHLLKGRKEWEEHYLPRLQFSEDRINKAPVYTENGSLPFGEGGLEYLKKTERTYTYGIYCGSLFGVTRCLLGIVGTSYLMVDDEPLLDEIIETIAELCYQCTETVLNTGVKFDYGHFWEDICFKNGPLVSPRFFEDKTGHHYRRITKLLNQHGIELVSLDCDGWIDALIPTWIDNGVNTMFPIEVGTWNASIKPWREKYGKKLRGVGGMDKKIFSKDYAAVDKEIERLKPLVGLGGYIPCPDHRIAPDAKWENVQYYCDKMRKTFC